VCALKKPGTDVAEPSGSASGALVTTRFARREAIAIIGAAILLLGAVAWLAHWFTAWSPRAVLRGQGDTWPLAFTSDGTGFATAGTDGVTLWETATGLARAFWPQTDGSHSGMAAFSPDGLTFAAIDFFGPGSPIAITLRDVPNGRVRWTLPIPNEGAYAILFTAAGNQVRAVLGVRKSNSGEIVDIDVASGREVARRRFTMVVPGGGSAVSSDGRLMAFRSGTSVILWNLENDSEHAAPVISAPGPTVSSAGFSPDRSTLAIGLSNGSIEIWDLPALKYLATIGCHKRGVRSAGLQLSPDGRTIASWGQFSRADSLFGAIWDSISQATGSGPAARHEVVVADCITGERIGVVSSAVHPFFSPGGRTLAVRDGSMSVELFDLPASEPGRSPQREKRAESRGTRP
jgi:WD40 repeat protein